MGRLRLIFLIAASLGLMVLIDGLLKGETVRPLLGLAALALFAWMAIWGITYLQAKFDRQFAEQMATRGVKRNWTYAIASAAFALLILSCAVAILVVPFEYLLDWSKGTAGLVSGLESLVGQVGARILLSALFFFAGGAAAKGAWTWFRP